MFYTKGIIQHVTLSVGLVSPLGGLPRLLLHAWDEQHCVFCLSMCWQACDSFCLWLLWILQGWTDVEMPVSTPLRLMPLFCYLELNVITKDPGSKSQLVVHCVTCRSMEGGDLRKSWDRWEIKLWETNLPLKSLYKAKHFSQTWQGWPVALGE